MNNNDNGVTISLKEIYDLLMQMKTQQDKMLAQSDERELRYLALEKRVQALEDEEKKETDTKDNRMWGTIMMVASLFLSSTSSLIIGYLMQKLK